MFSSVRVQREGLSCLTLEHYLQQNSKSQNGFLCSFIIIIIFILLLFLFLLFFLGGPLYCVIVKPNIIAFAKKYIYISINE